MRLYASSIAIVSGAYSIGSVLFMDSMAGAGTWIMLLVGIIVVLHGIGLLTALAEVLGRASGPLMVLWAVVMLLNQGLAASMSGWMMDGPMMTPGAADDGMIALAILMLMSGLIMTAPGE